MTDYDPLRDLSELFAAVLNYRADSHEYADRIASRLGLGEDDTPRAVHEVLAKALGNGPATPAREQAAAPDPAAFPLTCTWCSNSPATHLAVADWSFPDGPQRLEHMLCANCAHGVTVLPGGVAAWWLFALVPDDPHGCKGGFR